MGVVAGAAMVAPASVRTWPAAACWPSSTVTNPPPDFGPNAPPTTSFPSTSSSSILRLAARPGQLVDQTVVDRRALGRGRLNSVGRFLVWSDIPNNLQLRWLGGDGRVTVFRNPSNNSNGNTFPGPPVIVRHLTRQVVRYGGRSSRSSLIRSKEAPELSQHWRAPDGSCWFTDPPYGGNWQRQPDAGRI
jgi:gluconolactonase